MNKLFVLTLLMISLMAVGVFAQSQVVVSSLVASQNGVTFESSNSETINFAFDVLFTSTSAASSNFKLSLVQVSGPSISSLPQKTFSAQNGTTLHDSLDLTFLGSAVPGNYAFKVKAEESVNASVVSLSGSSIINVAENSKVDSLVSEIKLNGEPGSDIIVKFTLKNVGNVDIRNLRIGYTAGDFGDSNDDKIELSIIPLSVNLAKGRSQEFTINANVDSRFDTKKFTSSLNILADNGLEGSIPLKVDISPLSCPSQSSDSDISIDINNPEDGDSVSMGSKVQLDINVENRANGDVRYKVVALLYNLDKERKVDSKTVTQRIKDGDDKDFLIDLETGNDLDEDTALSLFVKVYDIQNEEGSCYSDSVDLDFSVPDHKLTFDSLSLGPTLVSCGDLVSGGVVLRNIGLNDENVLFTLSNTQLGLQDTTRDIRINSDRDENTRPLTFNFRIPDNVGSGNYNIEMKAVYSGEQTTDFRTITVGECSNTQSNTGSPSNSSNLNLGNTFTGSTVNTSFWDKFSNTKIPMLVWVLVDILLVILIIGTLVFLFKKK